jgi:multidrug efflux pump
LPEGSSLTATDVAAKKLEALLAKEEGISNFVAYVGAGSPRFYLPLDQQLAQAGFAQLVVTAENIEQRERIREKLLAVFPQMYPDLVTRVLRLENGPPVGYQVQYRVAGDDPVVLQKYASRIVKLMSENPNLASINLDWGDPSKVARLVIDQDRAQALGVSTQSIAQFMQTSLSGGTVTYLREKNRLVEIQLRGPPEERARLSLLGNTAIPRSDGSNIPLNQIAHIEYGFEDGIIWRRNRQLTMTARCSLRRWWRRCSR